MPTDTAAGWTVLAGLIGTGALVIALGAQARLTRVRRSLRVLRGHAGDGDLLDVAEALAAQVAEQRRQLDTLTLRLDQTRRDVGQSLRHVAVVRDDGDGTPGRGSFCAAVVDDLGDGIVLTCPAGPGDPRTVAKGLVGGVSDEPLSPQEARAVQAATATGPPEHHPTGPRTGRPPGPPTGSATDAGAPARGRP